MNVRFECPSCRLPSRAAAPGPWRCPRCGQEQVLTAGVDEAEPHCAVCAHPELYRKKDFPHALGLGLLAVACAGFLLGQYLYHQWLAWAVLIGSAIVDGLLYLWVRDVVVCYRCGAEHRQARSATVQPPFELGIAERYRQERLRREHLRDYPTG